MLVHDTNSPTRFIQLDSDVSKLYKYLMLSIQISQFSRPQQNIAH